MYVLNVGQIKRYCSQEEQSFTKLKCKAIFKIVTFVDICKKLLRCIYEESNILQVRYIQHVGYLSRECTTHKEKIVNILNI